MDPVISLLIGLTIGALVGWVLAKLKFSGSDTVPRATLLQLEGQVEGIKKELKDKQRECEELIRELATSDKTVEHYHKIIKSREQEVNELHEKFKAEFENLAQRLLEEKSKKFTEQNQLGLNALLKPLQERLADFDKRLQVNQVEETKQRSALGEQIKQLAELNHQMSDETRNLTKALRGESKAQGNWGELILEKVLEKSGLIRGREFDTQLALASDGGQRRLPDVVIYLPENRHIIIDSKVSLTAYERFSSTDDESLREKSLKEHVNSLKTHLKQLGEKNYPALNGLNSPDFVLMFVPIESAFAIALQYDSDFIHEAFEKNIIVVSPTTLLATTRTISGIWRQERQNQHALEIARVGGDLYDKFVAFVQDLESIGDRLRQANDSYDLAMNKLQTGKGSLTRRAQKLVELGAKAAKKLPKGYIEEEDELKIEN